MTRQHIRFSALRSIFWGTLLLFLDFDLNFRFGFSFTLPLLPNCIGFWLVARAALGPGERRGLRNRGGGAVGVRRRADGDRSGALPAGGGADPSGGRGRRGAAGRPGRMNPADV